MISIDSFSQVYPEQGTNEASFSIRVKASKPTLDYEDRKFVEFDLVASEMAASVSSATTRRNTRVPIRIAVKDVNDNGPDFEKESYTVNVLENAVPGTTVAVVRYVY